MITDTQDVTANAVQAAWDNLVERFEPGESDHAASQPVSRASYRADDESQVRSACPPATRTPWRRRIRRGR